MLIAPGSSYTYCMALVHKTYGQNLEKESQFNNNYLESIEAPFLEAKLQF